MLRRPRRPPFAPRKRGSWRTCKAVVGSSHPIRVSEMTQSVACTLSGPRACSALAHQLGGQVSEHRDFELIASVERTCATCWDRPSRSKTPLSCRRLCCRCWRTQFCHQRSLDRTQPSHWTSSGFARDTATWTATLGAYVVVYPRCTLVGSFGRLSECGVNKLENVSAT